MKDNLKTVLGIIVVIAVILGIYILDRLNNPIDDEQQAIKIICEHGNAITLRKGYVYDDMNKKDLCGYYEEEFNKNGQCVAYRLYEVQVDSEENNVKLVKEERYIYIYNPAVGIWERFLKEKSQFSADEEPRWITFEYRYEFDEQGNFTYVSEIYNSNYINNQLYCEYTYDENESLRTLTLYDKKTNEDVGLYIYKYDEEGRCIGRSYKERNSEGVYSGHATEWYEWEYSEVSKITNEVFTLYEPTYDYRQIKTKWNEMGSVISLDIYESKNWYKDQILMQFDDSGNCIGGDLYRYDFKEKIKDTQYITFEYQKIEE